MNKSFFKWAFTNIYFYLILALWFVLTFFTEPEATIDERIITLPFMALILLIPFLVVKFVNEDRKKKDFPIRGWKWVIYIIGWFGMISLIFWAYQYLFYLSKNYGDKFFSMEFHKRTYYWGWVVIVSIILIVIVLMTI